MKKTLLICCIAAMGIPVYAQQTGNPQKSAEPSKQSALATLSNDARKLTALLEQNNLTEARSVHRAIVVDMLGEIEAAEQKLIKAKGTPQEKQYADLVRKQSKLRSEFVALHEDLVGQKTKMSACLAEFINCSSPKQQVH